MKFRFDIKVTEADYLEFNKFILFRSHYRTINMTRLRTCVLLVTCIVDILMLIFQGISRESIFAVIVVTAVAAVFCLALPGYYVLCLKGIFQKMKKSGKLPYSPSSTVEFNEDGFVETTETSRDEQKYTAVERISIVGDEVIYIHMDAVKAYILPRTFLGSGAEYDSFVEFISSKCAVVERY